MLGLVKMCALSAVLSYGVVTAINAAPAGGETMPTGKVFYDRLDSDGAVTPAPVRISAPAMAATVSTGKKGDRLAEVVPSNCSDQEWPYVSAECLSRDDGRPKPGRVRVITIEHRAGTNVSILQRSPQIEVANR